MTSQGPDGRTDDVEAIVFDLFGTVVDWRGSIIAAGQELSRRRGSLVDWGRFADEWRRQGYLAPIGAIVRGERPWQDVEQLLREELDRLIDAHALQRFSAPDRAELFATWRRLTPWPDSVPGLLRLRERYVLAPLSNGSFALLTELAKTVGLPWDCIISTELFTTYKPDPRTYLGAAKLLGLAPHQVMLAAAHVNDLQAAHACGLATAYLPRPLEWGSEGGPPAAPDPVFDVVAADVIELADLLVPRGLHDQPR